MPNDLLKLLVVAAVAFIAYNILVKNNVLVKNQGTMNTELLKVPVTTEVQGLDLGADKRTYNSQLDDAVGNPNVLPPPQMSNNFAPQGNFEPSNANNFAQLDCFPKDQLMAQDLLPPEGGFSESNPATQGQLMNRNLFESAHHAGLNTQSNTLRNANRQIRSDPVIVRQDVGPWHQSTYEADTNRRTFELGMA